MPLLNLIFLFTLFFLSGMAGLLYQVMWMKELSLLFGSSTQSAAVTTAAFFLGLAVGAQVIGQRVKKQATQQGRRFLLVYAGLELAIAFSALLYFALYPAFNGVYASVFTLLQGQTQLLLVVKLLLAMLLLSIPAFFMGGTLPVMAELVVDVRASFARRVAGIYFINTLGACVGAIAAGFWLPALLGFTATYLIAVGISLALALLAWGYGRYQGGVGANLTPATPNKQAQATKPNAKISNLKVPTGILLVAAWSGFASLALQVLWTRLFAQVLHNSTYTYSAILAVFLFALTLGALLARRLAGAKPSETLLAGTLLLSGLLVALTPVWFMQLTDNMSYVGGRVALTGYVLEVVGLIAAVIGPAVLVMGICLPYLYKLVEQQVGEGYAQMVGRINSVNTYAAIGGSLLAGFVLFYWLGTWQAIHAIALLYMLAALLLLAQQRLPTKTWMAVGVSAVAIILLNPGKLPVVTVDPVGKNERLLQVWEGSAGTVAVVDQDGNLKTKLNNWYALGGSKAKQMEAMQTHLPVNLHGQPQSVFYLGLGTGITAGTILNYATEKVVVAELVKQVITASERYFGEFNNGLFDDPRVEVVNEDGRHYLTASQERFDLIIADLFIPWRAGVGNLYALEHYQSAKQRLNEGGFYVQWLPMYQLSQAEFSVIAKTMTEAFPLVTAWRGDFFANKPVMALIGHQAAGTLADQRVFRQTGQMALANYGQRGQVPLLSHYIGQVDPTLALFREASINSDDYPVIEYQAPASHRAEKSGQIDWLTGAQLLSLMRQLQSPQDPFLEGLSEAEVQAVFAGYFLHAAQVAKELDDERAERSAMAQFNALIGKSAE